MIHGHEGGEKKFFSKIWDDKQIHGRLLYHYYGYYDFELLLPFRMVSTTLNLLVHSTNEFII